VLLKTLVDSIAVELGELEGEFFAMEQKPGALVASLKLTASLHLDNGWLKYKPFLLGSPVFRSKLLVSESLESFFEMRRHF